MPPKYVRTIREEIYYEYAKLISRSAYGSLRRPFITDRFKKLRDGEIAVSGTMREWEREQELPKQCVYCGSMVELTTDHLIPRSRGGDDSADNLVLACQPCNTSRGEKGVFEWLGLKENETGKKVSPAKFLNTKDLKSHGDKILAFGYFLEKAKGFSSFNLDEIEGCYMETRLPKTKNFSPYITQLIRDGVLMDAAEKKDNKKAWTLTDSGLKYVEGLVREAA